MGYFNTYGRWVSDEELMHVGRSKLDGAKRGSGRFPLGSGARPNQHRGGSRATSTTKSESTQQKINGIKPTGNPRVDKIIGIVNQHDILMNPDYKRFKENKLTQREKEATDLGLKALVRNRYVSENEIKDDYRGMVKWFLYEDQTFGHLQVADLAKRGMSSSEIIKTLGEISSAYDAADSTDDYATIESVNKQKDGFSNTTWSMSEFDRQMAYAGGYKYVNSCVDIANEEKNKKRR